MVGGRASSARGALRPGAHHPVRSVRRRDSEGAQRDEPHHAPSGHPRKPPAHHKSPPARPHHSANTAPLPPTPAPGPPRGFGGVREAAPKSGGARGGRSSPRRSTTRKEPRPLGSNPQHETNNTRPTAPQDGQSDHEAEVSATAKPHNPSAKYVKGALLTSPHTHPPIPTTTTSNAANRCIRKR